MTEKPRETQAELHVVELKEKVNNSSLMKHRKLREECLNGEIFYSLKEARIVIEQWRQQYNRVRPHAALGYRPPAPGAYTPPGNPVPRPQIIM